MSNTAYGKHYKYVCEGVSTSALRSPERFGVFLQNLCTSIGMRALAEPQIFEVAERVELLGDPQEDEGGVSGLLALSTSHIAAHGWPLRGLLIVDVFSCREFDPQAAALVILQLFGLCAICGTDFSSSMECAEGVEGPIKL